MKLYIESVDSNTHVVQAFGDGEVVAESIAIVRHEVIFTIVIGVNTINSNMILEDYQGELTDKAMGEHIKAIIIKGASE